jgi:hypothetical protein
MYLYNANAIGLAGSIRRPFQEMIQNQASTCLGTIGGVGRANVENFSLAEIVSFRRAYVETFGGLASDGQTHYTSAVAAVEGLNVLDIITADRVIAKVSSRYREGEEEPRIVVAGTQFENLRIMGEPVGVELGAQFFDENDTFAKLKHAFPKLSNDRFRKGLPAEPRTRKLYSVSLVERVSLQSALRLKHRGSHIEIADFGRIYLAEFLVQPSHRQLNMLRLELGSPVAGTLLIASASCNGLAGDSGKDDD